MKKILQNIKSVLNKRLLIGIVVGAIAGYAYYYFIGCSSGTCAITSNPVNSTLYGILFGALLLYKKKPDDKEKEGSE
jgi:phage shock protein E